MQIYKPEGFERLAKQIEKKDVERAATTGEILSGYVVKCDQNLTLMVKIADDIEGEILFEDLEYSPYGDVSKPIAAISKVGKVVNFKVLSYTTEDGVMKAKLSRKASMQEAFENFVDKLEPGEIVDAKITHIEKYGAFCDIACGLTYLLPIENFCVTRIDNAQDVLKGVNTIKAVVYGKNKAGKIVLTHKELLGTWDEEAAKFEAGNVVIGTVRSVETYGVFIELTPNLSGLAEATDKVKVGDKVNILIKSIIPEKMKIKLNILDLDNGEFENDPRIKFKYTQTTGKIDRWKYSSDKADKLIETDFTKQA